MKDKKMYPAKSGYEYGKQYMLPESSELKAAMAEHVQHHSPESSLDGKTVPYSIMDDKHFGRR